MLFFQARQLGSFHYVPESLVRVRVSTTIEHLRKRLDGIDRSLPARERLRQCFVGLDHYLDLIRNSYGPNDSDNPVRNLSSHKQYLLLALALLAVHEDDRPLARWAYLSLLRQAPLCIHTYFRLGWTFMPRQLSLSLSSLLPSKYRRALMGPPTNKTEWWTDLG